MASDTQKILLTGATGFLGGSILTTLLESSEPSLKSAEITCLLRGAERAIKLSATYGERVRPVLYEGLDDVATATAVAAEHDIAINASVGFHAASAEALVKGLGQRKATTGRDVWIIQTSGATNIGDAPFSKPNIPIHVFDDMADDIYGHEKTLEAEQAYPQRTTELGVIDNGLALGVKTLVIESPLMYGDGKGTFNTASAQTLTHRTALKRKAAAVVGDGKNVWGHVHVADLADLYKLVLLQILDNEGKALPSGKKGIIFSAHGERTLLEQAELVAAAGQDLGLLPDKTVQHLSPEEAARELLPPLGLFTEEQIAVAGPHLAENLLGTNLRTVPSVARKLGWNPLRGEDAWE
jgi:nucleoside-diphosphate-sugar epimerase